MNVDYVDGPAWAIDMKKSNVRKTTLTKGGPVIRDSWIVN
ncbi:hypothetical protein BH10PLA2_BH10PLA2_08830 [soil metagenome]